MILKPLFVGAALLFSAVVVCSSAVYAADAPPCVIAGEEKPASVCSAQIRLYAATCYVCHGPNGKGGHAIPGLAGQDKAHLFQAMKEQLSGARETTVMRKYMLGYSETEMEQMAEFFARIK